MSVLFKRGPVWVRDSKLEDVLVLRETMRREDRDEVWASHHFTPEKALLVCYSFSSVCHTLLFQDTPIAMFGVIPDADVETEATIWFLGSEIIETCKKSFLEACRLFIDGMLGMYPVLYNYVDARYRKSVRWLKWCGAEISEAQPWGVENLPFHYIRFRRA